MIPVDDPVERSNALDRLEHWLGELLPHLEAPTTLFWFTKLVQVARSEGMDRAADIAGYSPSSLAARLRNAGFRNFTASKSARLLSTAQLTGLILRGAPLQRTDPFVYLALLLCAKLGLRPGECVSVRWWDFLPRKAGRAAAGLIVGTANIHTERLVPLSPRIARQLQVASRGATPSDYILGVNPRARKTVLRRLNRWLSRQSLAGLSLRDLRTAYIHEIAKRSGLASAAVYSGTSMRAIQRHSLKGGTP
jgi:integrase